MYHKSHLLVLLFLLFSLTSQSRASPLHINNVTPSRVRNFPSIRDQASSTYGTTIGIDGRNESGHWNQTEEPTTGNSSRIQLSSDDFVRNDSEYERVLDRLFLEHLEELNESSSSPPAPVPSTRYPTDSDRPRWRTDDNWNQTSNPYSSSQNYSDWQNGTRFSDRWNQSSTLEEDDDDDSVNSTTPWSRVTIVDVSGEEICPICLEPLESEIAKLPCGHMMHKSCAHEYFDLRYVS